MYVYMCVHVEIYSLEIMATILLAVIPSVLQQNTEMKIWTDIYYVKIVELVTFKIKLRVYFKG